MTFLVAFANAISLFWIFNDIENCIIFYMMDNVSVIIMFTLSGLNDIANYRVTLFALTLLCYCVIWLSNVTIIVTIIMDKSLHEPMYIFLCNLCINGLYGTAGFYPKFLVDLLSTTHVISYAGCLLQGFVLHSSACADFSLLVLMAYDRYVAICRPLVYHSVMTTQKIAVFLFFAWLIPLYLVFIGIVTTLNLQLCGSHIPKIYCIHYLMRKLACSATIANIIVPAFNYTFYSGHFIFVVWSYIYMIRTCLTSKENRSKFLQTCLPHLFCLIVVVGSLLSDLFFTRFGSKDISQSVENFMAIEFLVVPPIINPLIYGFKLTRIRIRIQSFMCSKSNVLRQKS
ncbi:olfactory receptor 6N1-like [Dicentrarchus labrax]|uniref:G-protein coupled receptors family 1 profile domain-containing protein n=1 Tax=Dicentrarchus labrax TaxID=13489 RepID=A0A8C4D8Z8_DICLA|nr:olfactory receptor 6N1-like [Dicentrarchus labrax]